MYTLLYGFYKYVIQKDEYCVLILGLDNAGKTVSWHVPFWQYLVLPTQIIFLDLFRSGKNKIYKKL